MTTSLLRSVSDAMTKHRWTPVAPGAWTTTVTNGASVPVVARLEGEWLRVEAELPERPEANRFPWLFKNATLPPLVRLAFLPAHDRAMPLGLIADLAEDGGGWSARVEVALVSFHSALHRIHAPATVADQLPPDTARLESVRDRIRESGVTAALENETGSAMPHVEPRATGLALWVPLVRNMASADDERGEAIALFLLASMNRLRAVRAAARREGAASGITLGWEAPLSALPEAPEIERALTALTVACERSRRELEALACKAVSKRYLSQFGECRPRRSPLTAA